MKEPGLFDDDAGESPATTRPAVLGAGRELPARIVAVIDRALARAPEERFPVNARCATTPSE